MCAKPIRFSRHALEQMRLRGATELEVEDTIHTAPWEPAKRGKQQACKRFSFGQPSPISQRVYRSKTVRAIFAEETKAVVVVTVIVYYSDQEG